MEEKHRKVVISALTAKKTAHGQAARKFRQSARRYPSETPEWGYYIDLAEEQDALGAEALDALKALMAPPRLEQSAAPPAVRYLVSAIRKDGSHYTYVMYSMPEGPDPMDTKKWLETKPDVVRVTVTPLPR